MKQREIDNMFRKNLEAHPVTPSAEAWKKVESQIRPDKVTWRFYVAIAASLLLVAVVGVLVFYPGQKEVDTFAENTVVSPVDTTTKDQAITEESVAEVFEEEIQPEEASSRESTDINKVQTSQVEETQAIDNTPSNNSVNLVAEVTEQEEQVNSKEEVFQLEINKTTGIADVEEEVITDPIALNVNNVSVKMPQPEEITEQEESESGRGISLKKVLDIAKNLKTDNDGWSTLREAKNELLTFGRKKNDNKEEDSQ